MRKCARCGVTKPLEDFPPRKDRPVGRMSRCHECDRARSQAYYLANREKVNARTSKALAARNHRDRAAAIAIYGGRCVLCQTTEALEFDHVDGDGGEHRKREEMQTMVRRIARTGRTIDDYRLRLLCKPCHRGPGWQERLAAS